MATSGLEADRIQDTLKSVYDLQGLHSEMASTCLMGALILAFVYLVFYLLANAKSNKKDATKDLAGELVNITILTFLGLVVLTESLLIVQGKYDFIMPVEQKIALLFGCIYLFFDTITKTILYFEVPFNVFKEKWHVKLKKNKPIWTAGKLQKGNSPYPLFQAR